MNGLISATDAGTTVYAKDEEVNQLMERTSDILNLQSHICGFSKVPSDVYGLCLQQQGGSQEITFSC